MSRTEREEARSPADWAGLRDRAMGQHDPVPHAETAPPKRKIRKPISRWPDDPAERLKAQQAQAARARAAKAAKDAIRLGRPIPGAAPASPPRQQGWEIYYPEKEEGAMPEQPAPAAEPEPEPEPAPELEPEAAPAPASELELEPEPEPAPEPEPVAVEPLDRFGEPEFEVGDVVQLKSGGPLMTVGPQSRAGVLVNCAWISGEGMPRTKAFAPLMLRRVLT